MVDVRSVSSKVAHALTELFWTLPIHTWGRPNPKPNAGIWGDLDDVELVIELEKHFEIKIADEESEATQTLGQMQDLLVAKRPDLNEQIIWRDLCRITSEIGNGKADEYTRDTMFLCRI